MTDAVDTDALRARADENAEWAQVAFGLLNREQDARELLLNADVLRAAADEVDRLRLSDSNATQQRDQLANALRRSDNENDRLRAVIENAAHDSGCQFSFLPEDKPRRCTCWKADAL